MAAAPRILMPREMRSATEYSPPFYTLAQKVTFGITTEAGSGDHTFGLQMWLEAAQDWRTIYTAALPIEWDPLEPVTRYTFHNHVFGLVSYSLYDFFVKAYLPSNAPLRVAMTYSGSAAILYSVMASDCISVIEAVVFGLITRRRISIAPRPGRRP